MRTLGSGSYDNPKIERFPSVASFMEAFHASGAKISDRQSWTGETRAQVENSLANGNTDSVAKAEAILATIDANVNTRGLTRRWANDVVGAFPNVPAYLAGQPESMRRMDRQQRRSRRSAVRVYYSPVSSQSISHEQNFRRGVVVLAAVMALQRVRPVEVYYFTVLGLGDHVIKLRTDPMVLSESAYVLTSGGVCRSTSYPYAHAVSEWRGDWGRWSGQYEREMSREAKIEHMKTVLGLGEDDILLPAVHMRDQDILDNPVAWINGLLDKYRD